MADILIIDSEPMVRAVVSKMLERAGHSVRATGEFNEARQMLQISPGDLVITNVFLRGITGHDAMRELRTGFPQIPVLMVSGLPDEKLIADWTGETGFDVFPKPFSRDALLDKVNEVLTRAKTELSSPATRRALG